MPSSTGVPGITTTLALSPLSPLSSNITTNFTAGAVLTFQAPDDYFDTISTYVVRTFDITAPVNVSGNNFTEAAYPAPSSNPLAVGALLFAFMNWRRLFTHLFCVWLLQIPLVFPDYRHVYGVEVRELRAGVFSSSLIACFAVFSLPLSTLLVVAISVKWSRRRIP
jgi:hypothetical protein